MVWNRSETVTWKRSGKTLLVICFTFHNTLIYFLKNIIRQSDGTAPHIMNAHFMHKKTLSQVCFYCDYSIDESYTAKRISIRAGTSLHDLVDIAMVELNEPVGWVTVNLADPYDNALPLRVHLLQVRVMSMHQNGRDTHIRQLKILGPKESPVVMGGIRLDKFMTTDMVQFAQVR